MRYLSERNAQPPQRFDLGLRRDALFSVPDAAGVHILCRNGTVWITLDGDPRDIVLEASDSFTTPEHRRALIYAMKPSCISVQAAAQPSGWRLGAPKGLRLEPLPQ